jgi:biopolymer transport protein ExbB/TolQ
MPSKTPPSDPPHPPAGLVIAIGTVIPFNLFRARIGQETKRIESAATLLEAACRGAQENARAS